MITGIAGSIGSGKSFYQLYLGLKTAERKQKQIITNFPLNLDAVYKYCKIQRYDYLLDNLRRGVGFSWWSSVPDMRCLMFPQSVCLLDEAGIFLNTRTISKADNGFLADLAQSRKFGCDLIYAAQFDKQVDLQFRLLTQYWHHCDGLSIYDSKSRITKLKYKKIYSFDAARYDQWVNSRKDRTSHFRTRFAYAFDYSGGLLTRADLILFDCFASHERLDQSVQSLNLRSIHTTFLPRNYYVIRNHINTSPQRSARVMSRLAKNEGS
jgi:Zonular occludens toxin (Zot)